MARAASSCLLSYSYAKNANNSAQELGENMINEAKMEKERGEDLAKAAEEKLERCKEEERRLKTLGGDLEDKIEDIDRKERRISNEYKSISIEKERIEKREAAIKVEDDKLRELQSEAEAMKFKVADEAFEIEAKVKEWDKREKDILKREEEIVGRKDKVEQDEKNVRVALAEALENKEAAEMECRRMMNEARVALADAQDELNEADRIKASVEKKEAQHLNDVSQFESQRENMEEEVEASQEEVRNAKARLMEMERVMRRDKKVRMALSKKKNKKNKSLLSNPLESFMRRPNLFYRDLITAAAGIRGHQKRFHEQIGEFGCEGGSNVPEGNRLGESSRRS